MTCRHEARSHLIGFDEIQAPPKKRPLSKRKELPRQVPPPGPVSVSSSLYYKFFRPGSGRLTYEVFFSSHELWSVKRQLSQMWNRKNSLKAQPPTRLKNFEADCLGLDENKSMWRIDKKSAFKQKINALPADEIINSTSGRSRGVRHEAMSLAWTKSRPRQKTWPSSNSFSLPFDCFLLFSAWLWR